MVSQPAPGPWTPGVALIAAALAVFIAAPAFAGEPGPAPPPSGASAESASEAETGAPEAEAAAPAVQRTSWTDRVTVGGRIWVSWMGDLTEGRDLYNAFDVGRTYLQARARLTDHFRLGLTLDAPRRVETVDGVTIDDDGVATLRRTSRNLDTVVKHAYGEIVDIGTKGLWLRFGMHGLPWVPYEEAQWTYRYQGTVLPDRQGYWSSTDLGVSLGYDLPSRHFAVVIAFVNGESWSSPESTKHKDLHARLTVRPLASHGGLGGLEASGAVSLGTWGDGDDQARRRFLGQLAFRHPHGAVAFTYLATSDPVARMRGRHPSLANSPGDRANGAGFSAWGWFGLGAALDDLDGLRLMARFDRWDPDTDLDDNAHTRQILGASYRFNKHVEFLLNVELTQWQSAAGPTVDETRLYLQSDWTF